MQEEIMYFAIAYIPYCVNLIMVTITSHIFINISQTVHFSAVKFTRVMRNIWAFFWYQNLRKFEKKSEAIGPDSFDCVKIKQEMVTDSASKGTH